MLEASVASIAVVHVPSSATHLILEPAREQTNPRHQCPNHVLTPVSKLHPNRTKPANMGSRYISNTFQTLLSPTHRPEEYLISALEDILTNYPPQQSYSSHNLAGLWSGPTGIAYLFLQVARRKPHLKVAGHHALTWAKRYIAADRGHVKFTGSGCGIHEERLVYYAVRAAITTEEEDVRKFVADVERSLEVTGQQGYPFEVLYGWAGCLYLVRLVKHWVPGAGELVKDPVDEIVSLIMRAGPEWKWHGKRYLGAVHGDIGIVTQLVLTKPEVARDLEPVLARLLDIQQDDGNWPSSWGKTRSQGGLVQVCHGAAGYVHSLLAIREHFPGLQGRIDEALRKGRECIWREGLLKKEPSLCHGIFGNAL